MPYIQNWRRGDLDAIIRNYIDELKPNGNLNYFLFKLAKRTCHSYNEFKEFIGELEACKLEIYRRLVAPYEDTKIEKNGDVE